MPGVGMSGTSLPLLQFHRRRNWSHRLPPPRQNQARQASPPSKQTSSPPPVPNYLSQPIQAPYCFLNPPPHRRSACVNHFIRLSRTGPWPWCLSRAVFCAVTLAVDWATAIWKGREGRTDKFALPHFRV